MVNGAYCKHCKTVIVSRHVHDFVSCKCECQKQICVDGGDDYRRRCWGPDADWDEIKDQAHLERLLESLP